MRLATTTSWWRRVPAGPDGVLPVRQQAGTHTSRCQHHDVLLVRLGVSCWLQQGISVTLASKDQP
jgi:hypothetical protein